MWRRTEIWYALMDLLRTEFKGKRYLNMEELSDIDIKSNNKKQYLTAAV